MKKLYITGIFALFFGNTAFCMDGSFDPNLFKGKKNITDSKEEYETTMWNEEEIHLEPGETKTKTLYTNGLGGCIAYALIVKCKNQSLHAQMSHYPPTDRNKQKLELLKANKKFEALCDNEVEFKKLLFMSEEDYVKKNGKWEQTIHKNDELYSKILGCTAGVYPIILPYSSLLDLNKNSMHDFEVSLNNQKSFYQSKSDDHVYHNIEECNK